MTPFLHYAPHPIRQHNEHDFTALDAERRRQKLAHITRHMGRFGMTGRMYDAHNHRLALLDRAHHDALDVNHINTYLQQRIVAETNGVFNNCFDIADEACDSGAASGVLSTRYGAQNFTGWVNHAINFHEPGDGTVVAFDLTAKENIFGSTAAQFDVLAIRTIGMRALIDQVQCLYGGTWQDPSVP